MYDEIHKLIINDLENYNKRPLTQKIISKEQLKYIQERMALLAKDEINKNLALNIVKDLDKNLYRHIKIVTGYGTNVTIHDHFIDILKRLTELNEILLYEEEVNLGFGKRARKHRKIWRKTLRKAHKCLNVSVKNEILWIKEYGKSRQTYILNATGELHNGLYWTFRELIHNPKYIKYGFKKENN